MKLLFDENVSPRLVDALLPPVPSGGEIDDMRKFNTAGPVRAGRHYLVPPLERFDLAEVLALVRDEEYFVLHAPRQTGKTSALLALRNLLNGGSTGDISGADAGHLVIFDMREGRSWEERIAREERTAPDGRQITVWGM